MKKYIAIPAEAFVAGRLKRLACTEFADHVSDGQVLGGSARAARFLVDYFR